MGESTHVVAVDGAESFLGKHIAAELAGRGVRTIGIVLDEGVPVPDGVEKRAAPLGDTDATSRALEGATCTILARKLLVEDPARGHTFAAVHVDRTRAFLEAAQKGPCERLLFVGLSRPERGGTPRSMMSAEDEVEKMLADSAVPSLYMRTSLVVGPRDGHVYHLARKAKRPGPLALFVGQGWARSAPIPAKDFATCVAKLALAAEFRTGDVSLGGRERLTTMDMFERLLDHYGHRKMCVHALESITRLVAILNEKWSASPYLTIARLSWLIENRTPEENAARELLGRFPRPFESAFGPGVAKRAAEGAPEPAANGS